MMKRLPLVMLMMLSMSTAFAQNDDVANPTQKEIIKERRETAKLTAKAMDTKILKDAKKQAKAMKKAGWQEAPGSLPLEKQLSNLLLRQYELNGRFPAYIIGKSSAKASTYGVARKQAITRARVEIATNMGAEIAALTESTDANTELSDGEVETIAKMVDTNKQLVQQSIGKTDIVMEAYREVDGKTEVQVGLSYDGKMAKDTLLKLFEKENEQIKQKLDNMTK